MTSKKTAEEKPHQLSLFTIFDVFEDLKDEALAFRNDGQLARIRFKDSFTGTGTF